MQADAGKPEFGPPALPPEQPAVTPKLRRTCKAIKKDGQPCGFYLPAGMDYCAPHDPSITKEQRLEWARMGGIARMSPGYTRGPKTPDEMLYLLAHRIDVYLSKCDPDNATAEELFALGQMSKAFAVLWDRKVEGREDEKQKGWRMRGAV